MEGKQLIFAKVKNKEEAQAIVERLNAAMQEQGEWFEPYKESGIPPEMISQMADVRLGLYAMEYFSGRLKEEDRREIEGGIALVLHQRMGAGDAYVNFLSGISIGKLYSNFWELAGQIADWLKKIAGLGGAPFTAPIDQILAAAIILYYYLNPPDPPCPVSAVDKWRHCYVGCKLAFWLPGGLLWAPVIAILKEICDRYLDAGTPEIADIIESIRGASTCGFFETCEDCCCKKGY